MPLVAILRIGSTCRAWRPCQMTLHNIHKQPIKGMFRHSTLPRRWCGLREYSTQNQPKGKRPSRKKKEGQSRRINALQASIDKSGLQADVSVPGPASFASPPMAWYSVVTVWTLASMLWGVMSVRYDDVPERAAVLAAHPDTTQRKLMSKDMAVIEKALKNAVECAEFSNDAKLAIGQNSATMERLFALVGSPATLTSVRNQSARLLEAVANCSDTGKLRLVAAGYHTRLIDLCNTSPSYYVRRKLGNAVCSLATVEENRLAIGRAGAVMTLSRLHSNRFLSRQSQVFAMQRISSALARNETAATWAGHEEGEWALIEKYSSEYDSERRKRFHHVKGTMLESGLLLYFHTAAGGLVWGAFEGWRAKKSATEVLRYALRTSLVTCMVPIYFVGASVSLYNYVRSQANSSKDILVLNTLTGISLMPWYWILPRVEKFSPYWIGGHVVGFVSFFLYLHVTRSDTLRNDNQLKQKDMEYLAWRARKERIPDQA